MTNKRTKKQPSVPKRLVAGALLALALLATSCGSSETEVDTASPTAAAEDQATSVPATDGTEQPTREAPESEPEETNLAAGESDSPIENLLGVPIFDDTAMQVWFEDLSGEAEILTATCMLSEGFEYAPSAAGVSNADEAVDLESREYAESRGLGIVADFNEAAFDPATAVPDKNQEYLATLTAGERDAYFVALTGTIEAEQTGDTFGQAGCRGNAFDEVFSAVAVLDAIEPVFEGYYDLYISDSRIIATTAQWQQCMSEAGYLFANDDEMYSNIFQDFNEILSDPTAFNEFDPEDFPGAQEDGGGSNTHPGLNAEARAKMDALGEREKGIAVSNWECREPIKDTELAVQREYEAQFVIEVGPQVQALRSDG